MFSVGQGLFGRINYIDGSYPEYDRPYLIIGVSNDKIGLLDVSSVKGKETKLLLQSNKLLNHYNPPFPRRSFVLLDSYREISINEASTLYILSNGETIDRSELRAIENAMKDTYNNP